MLTLVESLSLAGDRGKQNDDACGVALDAAWVIDGATDLHETPLTGWASDASWFASTLNNALHAWISSPSLFDSESLRSPDPPMAPHAWLRNVLQIAIDEEVAPRFQRLYKGALERWRSPIASLMLAREVVEGLVGLDLGDCRVATLDAAGASTLFGGSEDAADAESQLAAQQTDADKPLLRREATIARLREMRASLNRPNAHWTACLDPDCATYARGWSLLLQRPAHILLMTDGFSALVDRYHVYDAAGLVRAALASGLQELGRELRAIEAADAAGAKHPRFKPSDDATAILLRLT